MYYFPKRHFFNAPFPPNGPRNIRHSRIRPQAVLAYPALPSLTAHQYIFSPSISNRLISLNSLSTPLLGNLTRCVPPRLCPPTHTAPSYSSMSPVLSFQRRRLCARLSSSRRKASFLCMVVALFIASSFAPRNIRLSRIRPQAVPAYPSLPAYLNFSSNVLSKVSAVSSFLNFARALLTP